MRKLLIIGGGFAGLECARRLANNDRFEITLVDRTNHHLFQPLLYQVPASSSIHPPFQCRKNSHEAVRKT